MSGCWHSSSVSAGVLAALKTIPQTAGADKVQMSLGYLGTIPLPAALCVANESFRQITAWRNDRSPALFVGSISCRHLSAGG
jgi:hypothetical protein